MFGSQACAQSYCTEIIDDMKHKLLLINRDTIEDDLFDALLCDAAHKITRIMNFELKSRSRTGTTAVTVFIRKMNDGTHHIYCVNIGDSRAIMSYKDTVIPLSEDHNLKNVKELLRVRAHEPAEWYVYILCVVYKPKAIQQ